MIRTFVKDGLIARFEVDGTMADLGADTCLIINLVYNTIRKDTEDGAEDFKKVLQQAIVDSKDIIWEKIDIDSAMEEQNKLVGTILKDILKDDEPKVSDNAVDIMKTLFETEGGSNND